MMVRLRIGLSLCNESEVDLIGRGVTDFLPENPLSLRPAMDFCL
jgi:hypothetical protein